MAPTRTRTVKNKHAAAKSTKSGGGGGAKGSKHSPDGVSKPRSKKPRSGAPPSQQLKEKNRALLRAKPKKKTYTEEQLGIPKLNMITPVGVVKPKGRKKGKVFVDDMEGMSTILAMVQAEKDGQIESKMIKARQMEEIREARRVEAEKRESEKNSRLEDAKQSLRKKRNRKTAGRGGDDADESVKGMALSGSKATKPRKRVSFA